MRQDHLIPPPHCFPDDRDSNAAGLNSTFDGSPCAKLNAAREVSSESTYSPTNCSKLNTTYDASPEKLNATYDASPEKRNATYNASPDRKPTTHGTSPERHNETYDASTEQQNITCDGNQIYQNVTFDTSPAPQNGTYTSSPERQNVTFDRSPQRPNATVGASPEDVTRPDGLTNTAIDTEVPRNDNRAVEVISQTPPASLVAEADRSGIIDTSSILFESCDSIEVSSCVISVTPPPQRGFIVTPESSIELQRSKRTATPSTPLSVGGARHDSSSLSILDLDVEG